MELESFITDVLKIKGKEVVKTLQQKAIVEYVKKGDAIFHEGKKPEYIALSISGTFWGHFVNGEDAEVTDCLVSGSGYPLMPGFDLTEPAPATIESLSEGCIVKLRISDFMDAIKNYPEVMELYQKMTIWSGQYHMEKARILSSNKAEKKYRWFLENHPEMVNRVPDKYIASYLQMSPVTLSKIRKELRELGEVV